MAKTPQAAPAGGRQLLAKALSRARGALGAVLLFSLCINLLMLTAPLYMMQVFDRVLSSRSTETLLYLTLLAGIAFLALAGLEAVRTRVMVAISGWLDTCLGSTVLGGGVSGALRSGMPSMQGLRDLATFRTFLTGPAMFPILDAPWTPLFLVVIFLLHDMLGWLALGGAVVLLALAVINEMTTRRLVGEAGGASVAAMRQAEAAARNADVIEAMGMLPDITKRWADDNTRALDLQAKASRRSGTITAAARFLRQFLQIGIMGAAAWLVLQNEVTPGAMIAASILLGRALAPIDSAIGSWRSGVSARDAYRRMKDLLAEAPLRGTGMPLPVPDGRITVEGVRFAHPGAPEPILRNVSFALEPGECLGLVGPTASGKTTLARLMIGNLRPQAGHVRLDGMDVAEWEPEDLGRHIGYLPQDIELFSGTVRDNISRMHEAGPEDIVTAARLSDVHIMVLRLPNGYDTEVGDGGMAISGGQRQRIALARAAFGNPRLVVLDEPNASLDQAGEQALVGLLEALKEQGVTTVVIAHRPNILRRVDTLLVLGGGGVQMLGPRDEVLPQISPTGAAQPLPLEAGAASA